MRIVLWFLLYFDVLLLLYSLDNSLLTLINTTANRHRYSYTTLRNAHMTDSQMRIINYIARVHGVGTERGTVTELNGRHFISHEW